MQFLKKYSIMLLQILKLVTEYQMLIYREFYMINLMI